MNRLTLLACLAALWTTPLLAGSAASDQTRIQVRTAAGTVETMLLDDLQLGEVRNVQSAAGTPAVIGRHERGYVIDIAGERIEVAMPQLESAEQMGEALAAGTGQRIVVRKQHGPGKEQPGGTPVVERKVVVQHGAPEDGTPREIRIIHGGPDGLVEPDLNDPEHAGKRVLVTRKLHRHEPPATAD